MLQVMRTIRFVNESRASLKVTIKGATGTPFFGHGMRLPIDQVYHLLPGKSEDVKVDEKAPICILEAGGKIFLGPCRIETKGTFGIKKFKIDDMFIADKQNAIAQNEREGPTKRAFKALAQTAAAATCDGSCAAGIGRGAAMWGDSTDELMDSEEFDFWTESWLEDF